MRLVMALALFPLLAACTLPVPLGAERQAAALFDQGLRELAADGDTERLEELRRRYPGSPWSRRAEAIGRLTAGRGEQLRRLQNAERQLAVCRHQSASCALELEQVRRDLEELKRLVIETELRARPAPEIKH